MNNLLILLAVHLPVCLIFFGINIRFNGLQDSLFKFIVTFLLPVFGFLFFIIVLIINRTVKKSDEEMKEYLKSIHSQNLIQHEEIIDFEREINTIPLQDSLFFNDNKARRAYLIYMLKKNFDGHLNGLQKALKCEDSETSHYAAAALMEVKKQFEIIIQSAKDDYEKNANSIESIKNYASVLKKYLKSKIADTNDYYDYLGKYADLLGKLLKVFKEDEIHFSDKISADVALGDYKSALNACGEFLKFFPENEKPYVSFLKICYVMKDYESFDRALQVIKKRKFESDENLENIIRFWEGSRTCF